MRTLKTAAVLMLAWSFSGPVLAAEEKQIGWDDLAPTDVVYEDPFADLTLDQISDLANLLRLETGLEDGIDDGSDVQDRIDLLRKRLSEQEIDADHMFEQRLIVMEERRKAAMQPNPDVVGQSVRIPGYVIPMEMVDGKAVEFLLVPTVGACIHTPPPPANQMVYVIYPSGLEVTEFYTPVWVSGNLETEVQQKSLFLVDGDTTLDVTYKIDALGVELY